jgi:hypothetical protein
VGEGGAGADAVYEIELPYFTTFSKAPLSVVLYVVYEGIRAFLVDSKLRSEREYVV